MSATKPEVHTQAYTYGVKWRHRHFVGIIRHNALSKIAKIYRVIQMKLYQLI